MYGWEGSSITDFSFEEADHRTVRDENSSAIDVRLTGGPCGTTPDAVLRNGVYVDVPCLNCYRP